MHLNQTPIVTSTILFLSLLLSRKLLLQGFYIWWLFKYDNSNDKFIDMSILKSMIDLCDVNIDNATHYYGFTKGVGKAFKQEIHFIIEERNSNTYHPAY